MIRHIVMWQLQGDSAAERAASRAWVKQAFESLRGRIPGMLSLELGLDSKSVDCMVDP